MAEIPIEHYNIPIIVYCLEQDKQITTDISTFLNLLGFNLKDHFKKQITKNYENLEMALLCYSNKRDKKTSVEKLLHLLKTNGYIESAGNNFLIIFKGLLL